MRTDKSNLIVDLTFKFAIHIAELCELLESKRKFVISKQLLRCGTSIGANACEAQNAESTLDFIHKFKVAIKEAEETKYWLLLCQQMKGYPNSDKLIDEVEIILRIISKIITSTKNRGRK